MRSAQRPVQKPLVDHAPIAPRPLSRLSYQIMGLNLMAVLVLIAGIFYLDQYKKDLTTAETEILATEAKLYASVVSDNAVKDGRIDIGAADKLFNAFALQKPQRLRLFAPDSKLLIDTKTPELLPNSPRKKHRPGLIGTLLEDFFSAMADLFSINFELPFYPATQDADMRSFPDVPQALKGALSLSAWQSQDGGLILSAAVRTVKNGKTSLCPYR